MFQKARSNEAQDNYTLTVPGNIMINPGFLQGVRSLFPDPPGARRTPRKSLGIRLNPRESLHPRFWMTWREVAKHMFADCTGSIALT